MTHNTQALITTERERWLKLHLEGRMTISALSKRSGFSRDTLHRWKRLYLASGVDGLREQSRAHHSHPNTTPFATAQRIRALRAEGARVGARKIALRLKKRYGINMHWRGVHRVLTR